MAGKLTLKGQIAKEYLSRFPNTETLTLAKKIYKENAEVFLDREDVRTTLRYHRGAKGDKNRKQLTDKTHVRTIKNNFGLPKSEAERKYPYVFPKASKKILWLPDIHAPYHDVAALKVALQFGLDRGADTVGINGDLMDFYSLSEYETDPRKRNMKRELDVAREILLAIRETLPNALIIFKEGNHDFRWERYLMRKAPELLDMEEFRLDIILKLRQMDIQFIKGKVHMIAGKLNIIHGHEYKGGINSPVSIARNYLLKAKDNILVAHHHRTDEASGKKINGEMIAGWSMGTLGELSPEYMPYNEWNHGFAFQEILDGKGNFRLENKRIYNGKLY